MAKVESTTIKETAYNKITPKDDFEDSDYIQNITLATKIKGSSFPVLIVLYNAISFGGLSWTFSDNSEVTSDITFNGHYEIGEYEDIGDPPFAMYIPAEIDETTVKAAMAKAEA